MSARSQPVAVHDLGLTDYAPVLALQRDLRARRIAGACADTLLLTEHRPVFTLGRAHPVPDLRADAAEIERQGIAIIQTERGGDITWHGPGQLVAYPIVDLRARGLGVVDYVGGIEAAIIRVLGTFGLRGECLPGKRGVWISGRKIASVGIHVQRWVAMHGLALNVAPDLGHFALINACGLPGVEMTSIAREGHAGATTAEAREALLAAFEHVFGWQLAPAREPLARVPELAPDPALRQSGRQ